ncbi:MAG: ATP-dependent helicase [Candidatus Promineifilaceae bacterium]
MFNRLAQQQFVQRLYSVGLPAKQHPKVYTFHAFAYRFINDMAGKGIIPRHLDLWVDERYEVARLTVIRAIENLEERKLLKTGEIGSEEALDAISLWKGSLILPEKAGHRSKPNLGIVYAEFEKLRTQKLALTFDDFVPLAVEMLSTSTQVSQQWCERMDHIIVDEYQDVNHGQQRLIELLAGKRADLMVVGDDDQTIYEWRGARPFYITHQFSTVFNNKPQQDYTLSHSFRFGPVLAQAAYNCISQNKNRISKPLVAHNIQQDTKIHIYQMPLSEPLATAKLFTEQLIQLVTEQQVTPNQIVALARLYAQLAPLEVELFTQKVPYRVIGNQPFFRRRENVVLINYLKMAKSLQQPVTRESSDWLLSIMNKPSRYLPRRELVTALDSGRLFNISTLDVLTHLVQSQESSLSYYQREELLKLVDLLQRLQAQVSNSSSLLAGQLLRWLVNMLDYLKSFDNYYGEGEASFERKQSVEFFLRFSAQTGLNVNEYVKFLEQLDTTQGASLDQQIILTSIFKTKGLEFDFVFLPQCYEGHMPYWNSDSDDVYDKTEQKENEIHSPVVEKERRLFYVAVTRAKKAIFIEIPSVQDTGSQLPSRFLEEIQLSLTENIFLPYQLLMTQSRNDDNNFVSALKTHKITSQIMETLRSYYLPKASYLWAREAEQLLAELSLEPFTYRLQYSDVTPILREQTKRPLDTTWLNLQAKREAFVRSNESTSVQEPIFWDHSMSEELIEDEPEVVEDFPEGIGADSDIDLSPSIVEGAVQDSEENSLSKIQMYWSELKKKLPPFN